MNVNEIIFSGLLELYAAGLTSEKESVQVEHWLKEYPEVAAAYDEIQDGIEGYAQSQAVTPPAAIKDRIFSQINQQGTKTASAQPADETLPASVIKISRSWQWIAAASILLLAGSGVLNFILYREYHAANDALQNTKQELGAAQNNMNTMQQDMNIVQSRYSEVVRLNGVNTSPEATAKLFWMKNTGEVYIDPSNLPAISPMQQFQLWAIVDGKPVDAGLIVTDSRNDKYRIQKMKSFGAVNAFAITIEKKGGSATPTLKQMVVQGEMQKKL